MKIIFLFLSVIIYDICFGGYAGSLLKLSEDARNKGLAEATVAYVEGPNSIYINPAMLTTIKKPHILYTSNQWFENISINSLAGGWRFLNVPFAICITHVDIPDIVGINEKKDATGIFSASQLWLTIATAAKIHNRLHVGFAAKLYQDKIADNIARAAAFDLGYLFEYKEGFCVASAIRNLKIIRLTIEDDIPTSFIFGISYRFRILPLVYAAQLQRSVNEREWTFGWCLEYTLSNIKLRGGFDTLENKKFGMSAGIGIDYQRWGIDFAYTPYEHVGSTWAFSLYIKLGEGNVDK